METTFDYLRAHAVELGSRILETYPPLQSTKDPSRAADSNSSAEGAPCPGACHHRYREVSPQAKVGADRGRVRGRQDATWRWARSRCWRTGRPSATLVMCPSHITHKWAREVC